MRSVFWGQSLKNSLLDSISWVGRVIRWRISSRSFSSFCRFRFRYVRNQRTGLHRRTRVSMPWGVGRGGLVASELEGPAEEDSDSGCGGGGVRIGRAGERATSIHPYHPPQALMCALSGRHPPPDPGSGCARPSVPYCQVTDQVAVAGAGGSLDMKRKLQRALCTCPRTDTSSGSKSGSSVAVRGKSPAVPSTSGVEGLPYAKGMQHTEGRPWVRVSRALRFVCAGMIPHEATRGYDGLLPSSLPHLLHSRWGRPYRCLWCDS